MTTVRDVMTKDPEHLGADATARDAVQIMRERNVGSVPVVVGGRLQGIVTDRDIALRVVAEDRLPAEVILSEIATATPLTITPEMDVESAARLMAQHQVRRLPVVDGTDLVGIVSLGDLSVEGDQRVAGAALKDISAPATPHR